MRRPFRSGWCGLGAQPWQHARCLGGHDGVTCVCLCHQVRRLVVELDVAGLATALRPLVSAAGEVPPSVRRLHAAAVELLEEVAG